jgi:hypothetical protein
MSVTAIRLPSTVCFINLETDRKNDAHDEMTCFLREPQAQTVFMQNCIHAKFDVATLLRYTCNAGWSSLVARRAHNPKVVSSNLTPATNSLETKGLAKLQ